MKKLLLASVVIAWAAAPSLAADMPVKAPILKAPPVYNWTGFYIGGNGGGKWASTSDIVSFAPSAAGGIPAGVSASFGSLNGNTGMGGGQIGYNVQVGQYVFGLEADVDAQHWNTTNTLTGGVPGLGTLFVAGDVFSVDSRWQASFRGRVGYAWDRLLLYSTSGIALTRVSVASTFVAFAGDPATAGSNSELLVGYTTGAGLEYAFWQNVSIGVEGRYTWYGKQSYQTGTVALAIPPVFDSVSQNVNVNTWQVTGRLNWKIY